MGKFTMKLSVAAAAATIAISGAPVGSAATTTGLGEVQTLTNADGLVVTGYTVNFLAPSLDAGTIDYPVQGQLYQASVVVEALKGTVTPLLPLFNARAANGDTYRMLAAPSWGGVSGVTLAQGQKSSGRIYFDVTGDIPNSVVYNNGDEDLLIWVGEAMPVAAPPAPPPHNPMMPHNSGY